MNSRARNKSLPASWYTGCCTRGESSMNETGYCEGCCTQYECSFISTRLPRHSTQPVLRQHSVHHSTAPSRAAATKHVTRNEASARARNQRYSHQNDTGRCPVYVAESALTKRENEEASSHMQGYDKWSTQQVIARMPNPKQGESYVHWGRGHAQNNKLIE